MLPWCVNELLSSCALLTVQLTPSSFLQVRGGRAVFQFYPENADQVGHWHNPLFQTQPLAMTRVTLLVSFLNSQMHMVTSYAMKAGFTGGLVVDYPNSTRAKK